MIRRFASRRLRVATVASPGENKVFDYSANATNDTEVTAWLPQRLLAALDTVSAETSMSRLDMIRECPSSTRMAASGWRGCKPGCGTACPPGNRHQALDQAAPNRTNSKCADTREVCNGSQAWPALCAEGVTKGTCQGAEVGPPRRNQSYCAPSLMLRGKRRRGRCLVATPRWRASAVTGNDDSFSSRDWVIALVIWLVLVGLLSAASSCMQTRSCDHLDLVLFAISAVSMMAPAWLGTVVLRLVLDQQLEKPEVGRKVPELVTAPPHKAMSEPEPSPARPSQAAFEEPADASRKALIDPNTRKSRQHPERFCGHCRTLFTPNRTVFGRIRCTRCGIPIG